MATRNYRSFGSRVIVTDSCIRINFNSDNLMSTDSAKLQSELESFIADGLVEEVLDITTPVVNASTPIQKGVTGVINTQKAAVSAAPSNTAPAA